MQTCHYCQQSIVWGGVQQDGFCYCNEKCHTNQQFKRYADSIPAEIVDPQIEAVFRGPCPECQALGMNDIHTAHTVWSAGYITEWDSQSAVSCRSCATKRQMKALIYSFIMGWWGVPYGLIITPQQIYRNIRDMNKITDPYRPSAALEQHIRLQLAAQTMHDPRDHGPKFGID